MGVLRICDDSPFFVNGSPLSPTALNLLGDNLRALDEGTRLGGVAFCSNYGQPLEYFAQQAQPIWRGGGVWLTGMTTLRVVTNTTGTVLAGDTLRIYRGDDDTVYTDHTLASGIQTFTPSISASGYTHGQLLRVLCEVRHSATPPDEYTGSLTVITLAEFTPVFLADAAPFLPTFTVAGDITGTTLTQLAAYVRWLIRRAALRYDPLFIQQLRQMGPFRDSASVAGIYPNVIWRGGMRRTTLHTTLTIRGQTFVLWGGATESIRLTVNGTVVSTYTVPTTPGETDWTLTHNLTGYSVDSVVRVAVDFIRTEPVQAGTPIRNRWSVRDVSTAAPSGGASALGLWSIRQAGVTVASLLAWLTAARALCQALSDRITNNDALWGVQRLYTARPAQDSGKDLSQFALFEPWGVPTATRTAEAIVARGKTLRLDYSAQWYDEAEYAKTASTDEGIGAYPLKALRTTPLIDGDNVESVRLYLDGVPGLPVSAPYTVRGVESYVVMEQLKVVED